jgi:hypothetical protein
MISMTWLWPDFDFPNFHKTIFGGNGEYQRVADEKIWKSRF